MPDYKKLYHKLFNAMTDAITILQQAQLEVEEEYIETSENDNIKALRFKVVEKKED